MELFEDLLMTAFLALILSFLVAKLVSMAMAGDVGDDSTSNVDFETVTGEGKFDRGLKVQSTETIRRVQFVEQVVNMVDEFEGEESVDNDDVVDQIEEVRGLESGENQGNGIQAGVNKGVKEGELDGDEDDDWEGIERTELEKVFAAAVDYVGCGVQDDWLANVGSDAQMQLYGLHKVAMEGSSIF
ncbi:hypothetical protein F0562_031134 [Nyssa sinensis]|uniref:Uncharacterized protein n=1 Tax=Nyssa sinensis TaxID=561372 RepID=A0A5J5AUM7_9ASTE|nr:hypothetical protein F0562_031134 [Nyssa sinensis]